MGGGLTPLASPGYRYLFTGTTLTMAGYFAQVVAQGWLIYDLTGSPTWLGIVSFANGIPMLVLALPAGVLVDRLDRRKVLIFAQGMTALVTFVLAGRSPERSFRRGTWPCSPSWLARCSC